MNMNAVTNVGSRGMLPSIIPSSSSITGVIILRFIVVSVNTKNTAANMCDIKRICPEKNPLRYEFKRPKYSNTISSSIDSLFIAFLDMLKYLHQNKQNMKKIQEGLAIIEVPEESKISKKLEVFYNPVMKLNRDLTVLLLNSVDNKQMKVADIMAGTGVRSIRLLKELKKGKIERLFANDMNSSDKIRKNLKINKVKAEVHSEDANLFLAGSAGFDYIDIDPFGSPNDFLDSSIKHISRGGILGITATDTSVLCGTYPKTSKRTYWADTYRTGFMHESALRILIRKVQLIGMQYEKALIPIFSYTKEHYVRVFFRCIKGRKDCDELVKQHKYILYDPKTLGYEVSDKNFKDGCVAIGPLFTGSLNYKNLVKKMLSQTEDKEAKKLLETIYDESDIVGCYDIHSLCKKLKITVPNYESLLKKCKGTRVHYNVNGVKTKLPLEQLKRIIHL